jgi:hypothetical protein
VRKETGKRRRDKRRINEEKEYKKRDEMQRPM